MEEYNAKNKENIYIVVRVMKLLKQICSYI